MAVADQLERRRNLKTQLAEIAGEPDQEIIFRDTSPPRRRVTLYSRMDGEPLSVAAKLAETAMEKRLPDGSFMFTTNAPDAPAYKRGEIKCFLHPESNERMSGALDAAGLTGILCDTAHLASAYSKRIHAQHRHRQQWEAYQEHVGDEKQRAREQREESQLEATLSLARQAAGTSTAETCPECGKEFDTRAQLQGHKVGAHKEKRAEEPAGKKGEAE